MANPTLEIPRSSVPVDHPGMIEVRDADDRRPIQVELEASDEMAQRWRTVVNLSARESDAVVPRAAARKKTRDGEASVWGIDIGEAFSAASFVGMDLRRPLLALGTSVYAGLSRPREDAAASPPRRRTSRLPAFFSDAPIELSVTLKQNGKAVDRGRIVLRFDGGDQAFPHDSSGGFGAVGDTTTTGVSTSTGDPPPPGVQVERLSQPCVGLWYHDVTRDHGTLDGADSHRGGRTAALVLGGSAGGLAWSSQVASRLAAHGIPAMAQAYFDFRGRFGVPRRLEEIPLETFVAGMEEVRARSGADRVVLVGISKGAEAALLTACRVPAAVERVVAYVPSAYVFEGVYGGRWRNRSSWTWRGTPVPFLSYPSDTVLGPFVGADEIGRIHSQAIGRATPQQKEAARIPVENISAPVLAISAGLDRTWPSPMMAEQIAATMNDGDRNDGRHHRIGGNGPTDHYDGKGETDRPSKRCNHLSYPGAVHAFTLPCLPPFIGDDYRADAATVTAANRDAWAHTLAFLGGGRSVHETEWLTDSEQ